MNSEPATERAAAEDNVALVPRDPRAEAAARGRTKDVEPDPLLTRTGGAYVPPGRLRLLQQQAQQDKSSVEYQRVAWNALKKSLNGLINKVNTANIQNIVPELFHENLVRGRGMFCRAVMKAQAASQTFTHVYAALVAVINTKLPQTGELLLRRLVIQFRKAFRRNDKSTCLSSCKFVAHLVNQQVAHEVLALEMLTLLLERPTDDSVEVAIAFAKECGQYLADVSLRGLHEIFERLRGILHEGEIDKRVQYMIEVLFAIRKDAFKDFPRVHSELDLVEEADQITHMVSLSDELLGEDLLDVFKADPSFLENEEKYQQIRAEILGEGSDGGSDAEADDENGGSDDDNDDDEGNADAKPTGGAALASTKGFGGSDQIQDMTQTTLIALRRTIYLTIMSSASHEECAHKLMKMTLKPGQEMELAHMVIECCNQERSYLKFYGLLAQRFCQLNPNFTEAFCSSFVDQYATCHRLETNKLRHMAKMFAHLFFTDALPWTVFETIRLNETDTSSSSRIFIKELLLQMSEYLGMPKLIARFADPRMAIAFAGIFPKDNPRNTRFAINFFTSIGLGGLTDELREHWKNAPKMIMAQQQQGLQSDSESSSSSSSDSDSDSSSSSSSSSGSGSSSSSSVSVVRPAATNVRGAADKSRGPSKRRAGSFSPPPARPRSWNEPVSAVTAAVRQQQRSVRVDDDRQRDRGRPNGDGDRQPTRDGDNDARARHRDNDAGERRRVRSPEDRRRVRSPEDRRRVRSPEDRRRVRSPPDSEYGRDSKRGKYH